MICPAWERISVAIYAMSLMTSPHLIAQLPGLAIVLPEGLLILLHGAPVKVVLLPILQRPAPVCYDGRAWTGLLVSVLL